MAVELPVRRFAMIYADLIGELSYPELRVYLAISSFASAKDGKAWPGIATICKTAGIKDRRAVSRALRSLEQKRTLSVNVRGGPNKQNVYQITRDAA